MTRRSGRQWCTARAAESCARVAFPAFGGTAVVLVTDPGRVWQARMAVQAEVHAIDAACSRFRADSELSRVNAAQGEKVRVSRLFCESLETALRAARLTGGDVDPTCGASLAAAGYDRDFGRLSAEGFPITLNGFAPAPGWRTVEFDPERREIRLPPDCRLDFGATAKALAADRAAARAGAAAGCGVLVSLGGDLAVWGPAPDDGWIVRVTDDHRAAADAPGQTICLTDGALATSSTTVRRWSTDAGDLHHVLQPRTGRPAPSCWRTVSVVAATCVDANTAATASIVRGRDAPDWLTALRLPSRLVRHDGSALTLAGWPAEGDAWAAS